MSLLAGLLLRLFVFGVLVASANTLKFDFADVQQCDQVMVSFSGSNLTAEQVPASLEILPINSTALNISLVEPSLVYSGIALTFLPLAAGTDFLASLDDNTGHNIISVSDIIRVFPSPIGNDSCLPSTQKTTRRFSLPSNVSQCDEFTIQYDMSLVSQPPSVRLYNPTGPSFTLNMTSDTIGEATYLMSFSRGKEVVLLVADDNGNMETSPLFTVGGDANSDTSCLRKKNSGSNKMNDRTTDMPNTPATSRALIIGGAAGGSAVVMIAIGMMLFVIRDRRGRRKIQRYDFDPSRMQIPSQSEKGASEKTQSISSSRAVSNPIYTSEPFMSPTRSTYQRGSLASGAQVMIEDQTRPMASTSTPSSKIIVESPAERGSLDSLDIEGMLNMATLQSENASSRKNSETTVLRLNVVPSSTPAPSAHLTVPSQTLLKPQANMRRLRSPSDVPKDFDSLTFETYSPNPFDTRDSITPSILQNSLRSTGGIAASLTSPRDSSGFMSNRGRILSGLSGTSFRSSSGWYGIAR